MKWSVPDGMCSRRKNMLKSYSQCTVVVLAKDVVEGDVVVAEAVVVEGGCVVEGGNVQWSLQKSLSQHVTHE